MVDAFLDLSRRPGWETVELHVGGWISEKDRAFCEAQETKIREAGLGDRFRSVGSPDFEGKAAFLEELDVFCVPARFVEPKGIYALEAMACGVPVVAPDHGAFPEMLEASGGGRLFPKEDVPALVDTLASLLDDADARKTMGERGREWVRRQCGRAAMTETTVAVFERFLSKAGAA